MGKWGDESLHGKRKGEVMGKWGKKLCKWVIGRLEPTWERGENSSWAPSWAWESLGLVMGLGVAKGGEWVVVSYSFAPEYPLMFWLSFLP